MYAFFFRGAAYLALLDTACALALSRVATRLCGSLAAAISYAAALYWCAVCGNTKCVMQKRGVGGAYGVLFPKIKNLSFLGNKVLVGWEV